MKIIVFGASGRVGKMLVQQALCRGHRITAFLRDESRLELSHERLSMITGDARNEHDVDQAIENHDAVMLTLGDFKANGPVTLMSEASKHMLWAMKKHGVQRIIGVCGAGILQDNEITLKKNTPTFPSFMQYVSEDHLKVFTRYQNSDLNWTFVCPTFMPDGEQTGEYRIRMNYHPKDGIAIRTGDVAHFMLRELEENKFGRTRVGIAY